MAADFIRDRRRRKFWKEKFDRAHGVRTEYTIRLEDLDVRDKAQFSLEYQPTPPPALRAILKNLQIAYQEFIFIDLGSGLGRAVLVASEFPFKRIIGVEFSSELHRVAQENVLRFQNVNQLCRNINLVCVDALEYRLPRENTVFYMYNPFQGPKMERMMDNIRHSLEKHPRKILIAYLNVYHDLSQMAPFLEKVDSWFEAADRVAIYRGKENYEPVRRYAPVPSVDPPMLIAND